VRCNNALLVAHLFRAISTRLSHLTQLSLVGCAPSIAVVVTDLIPIFGATSKRSLY
jgi:hypothetical protein